ncbi:MAG TPA: response regulator [Caulobacteraceae bacterium]|jgi:signal transduction histidine kinase|nr:response regulator [Caulobacteraceae bacterium]
MEGRDIADYQGALRFLDGGGDMGGRMRAFDWNATPLGRPEHWPQALKTLVNLLLASNQPMFLGWGAERTWLYNDAFTPILGRKHPEALGRPAMEIWAEARDVLEPMFDRVFAGEPVSVEDFTLSLDRRGQVEQAHFEFAYTPARGEDGAVEGLFGACIETTARARAERLQADATERQRRQFQCAPGFIAILGGPSHVFEFVNDAYVRLIGERELIGLPVRRAVPEVEGQGFFELLDQVYATGERFLASQVPIRLIRSPGGLPEDRWLDFVYEPIFGEAGPVSGIFVEGFDVTETYQAQQRLRELNETLEQRVEERTRELRVAEAALLQAQKMEAVGQLTGGIAHDFNNLLTGVSGSLELLKTRIAQGRLAEADRYIAAAQSAARRAATLTQRLLAFSRRQTLDPRPTDINRLIAGMEDMLRRSVGPDVEVEFAGAGGLWLTRIDPAQLENALLNLCINGRDAMAPAGGRLTIETANKWLDERAARERELTPGQYVSLCVTDTGTGMAPEVIARAFDPFFTTKPLGEGTGLGLSMVYGFVRQSGGQVRIYSELGTGTTMCLYLPRLVQGADAADDEDSAPDAGQGDGETVLVIDDEPTIRMLIVEVLEECGYAVIEADTGPAGLRILQSDARIDLLITDVGLPGGMNGRQVADAAREARPGLKVLFITGFAENAVVGNGHLAAGMAVITKPFVLSTLSQKIRDLIDS